MRCDFRFEGRLTFADSAALQRAVDRARATLLDEEPRFRADALRHWHAWFRPEGSTLRVDVRRCSPPDDWFGVEALVRLLVDTAVDGGIHAVHDDAGAETHYETLRL